MVKHGIGWGAASGIAATEMAASGFTGIPILIDFERYGSWVAEYGRRWGTSRSEGKFRCLVRDVLPADRTDALLQKMRAFAAFERLNAFTELLG